MSSTEYDPIQIYNDKPIESDWLALAWVIIGILEIPINLMLLISTVPLFKKKTTALLKISFGILVFDCISAIGYLNIGLAALINGYYLPNSTSFCNFISLAYVGATYLSSWFVGLMSLERALIIIFNIALSDKFWIILMLVEVIYFFVINGIVAYLGQMELVTLAIYCIATPDSDFGFIDLISYATMMWLSTLLTVFAYLGIAIVQRRRAWELIRDLNLDKDECLSSANKIIRKVVFLLLIYLLGNLFEFINTTKELITGVPRSSTVDFISSTLLSLNPLINCILLIQMQDSVKKSFLKYYPFMFKCFYRQGISNNQVDLLNTEA